LLFSRELNERRRVKKKGGDSWQKNLLSKTMEPHTCEMEKEGYSGKRKPERTSTKLTLSQKARKAVNSSVGPGLNFLLSRRKEGGDLEG